MRPHWNTTHALDRDLAALAAAGLPAERTVDEWMAHPSALTELLVVVRGWATLADLAGYRLREAARLRERLADLPLPEQRRIARVEAIRDRLRELAAA